MVDTQGGSSVPLSTQERSPANLDIPLVMSLTNPDYLNQMVELAYIGLQILEANAPATKWTVDLDSINRQLGRWALRVGVSPTGRADDAAAKCHRIHYNLMLFHLYRQFDNADSRTVRSTAAQEIVSSLERLSDLGSLCQCQFTGVSAATAAGMHLVSEVRTATEAGNFLVVVHALDKLSRLVECAKLLAKYWPNADAIYSVFHDLHQKFEGYARDGGQGDQATLPDSQPDWNLLLSGAQIPPLDEALMGQDWLNMPTWSGLA
ncbi:Zn(2)-C6 fungal-type domain-containing protein [Fusarium sp. Ph1]|nr:Zn(2)-C6 fungal-type domain-containing protein [Fusarium sp. Ph1]